MISYQSLLLSTIVLNDNSNLITLFPNIVFYQNYIIYTKVPKEFNKAYRYCIMHTEKETDMIK